MSKKHNNTQPSTAVQPQSKDELLNNALMEMEEIEQSVLSISQMSSQVSEQFSEIGNTVKNFGYGVSDFITKNRKSLFNNKEDAEFASDITEIASDLLGGAIDFVGGIFSDYKKGKQLKKLLIAKQEIANAKIQTVEKLFKQMERNIKLFQTVVFEYINAEYSIDELKDSTIQRKHFDTMMQAMQQYKKAAFLFLITQFMLAEYNAWIAGNQNSLSKYPDERVLHGHILYNVLYPPISSFRKSEEKTSNKLINEDMYTYLIRNDAESISGRFLFFMIDEQLTSKFLLDTDRYAFMRISLGSEMSRSILKKNEAFKESQANYYELERLEDQSSADIIYYIYRTVIFLMIAFYGYLNYENHGWWFIPTVVLGYWFIPRKLGIAIYHNYKRNMATAISNCKKNLSNRLRELLLKQ